MENQDSKKFLLLENGSDELMKLNPKDFYNVTLQANERIQKLVDELSEEIKSKSGINADKFEALSYKSDIVVGTNYFIKVRSQDKYIHVRVFLPFPYENDKKEVTNVQTEKNQFDNIEYF